MLSFKTLILMMACSLQDVSCDASQSFLNSSNVSFAFVVNQKNIMSFNLVNKSCVATQKFLNINGFAPNGEEVNDGVTESHDSFIMNSSHKENKPASSCDLLNHNCALKLNPAFSRFMDSKETLVQRGTMLWLDSFVSNNIIENLSLACANLKAILCSEGAVLWDGLTSYKIPPLLARYLIQMMPSKRIVSDLIIFEWNGIYLTIAEHLGHMRAFAIGFVDHLCEIPFCGYTAMYSSYVLPHSFDHNLNNEVIHRLVQTVDDVCDRRWTILQLKYKLNVKCHTLVRAMPANVIPGWLIPNWEQVATRDEPKYLCKYCGRSGLVVCCPKTYLTPRRARTERILRQACVAQSMEIVERPRIKCKMPSLHGKKIRDITSNVSFVIEKRDSTPTKFFHGKVTIIGASKPFSHVKAAIELEHDRNSVYDEACKHRNDVNIMRSLYTLCHEGSVVRPKVKHCVIGEKTKTYRRKEKAPVKIVRYECERNDDLQLSSLFGDLVAQGADLSDVVRDVSLDTTTCQDTWYTNLVAAVSETCSDNFKDNNSEEEQCQIADLVLFKRNWLTLKKTPQRLLIGNWALGNRLVYWHNPTHVKFCPSTWAVLDRMIADGMNVGQVTDLVQAYSKHVCGSIVFSTAIKHQLREDYAGGNRPRNIYDVCAHSVVPIVKFYERHGLPYGGDLRLQAQGWFDFGFKNVSESVTDACDSVKELAEDVRNWLSKLNDLDLNNLITMSCNAIDGLNLGIKFVNMAKNGVSWMSVIGLIFDIATIISRNIMLAYERNKSIKKEQLIGKGILSHLRTLVQLYEKDFISNKGKGFVGVYGLSCTGKRVVIYLDQSNLEKASYGLLKVNFNYIEGSFFTLDSAKNYTFGGSTYRTINIAQGLDFDLGTSLLGMLGGLSKNMNILRNFNTIMSAWRSGKQLTSYLLSLLPSCVLEFFGLVSDNFVLTDEDFQNDIAKYAELSKTYALQPLNIKKQYNEKDLVDLYERMLAYHKRASLSANRGPVSHYLNVVVKELRTIITCHRDSSQLVFDRYNPYAILLSGAPGIGKSEVAKRLAHYFEDFAKDPDLIKDERFKIMAQPGIYCYQSQLDYMDGYCKEGVVIIDELGQRTDGEDLINLFSIISNNRYVCPMASMDDALIGKKGTIFTSHSVIACSNVSTFDHLTGPFVRPDAINRRFLMKLLVTSEGPRQADFSHLRFRINGSGIDYTLPQIAYILREHPTLGFKSFFKSQFALDHSSLFVEEVAMPKLGAQGLDFGSISRFLLMVCGYLSVRLGYEYYSHAQVSTFSRIIVSTTLFVTGLFSVFAATWHGFLEAQYEEYNTLRKAIEKLKLEHKEASSNVRAHLANYIAESGSGGGKHAAKAPTSVSKHRANMRSRIVVHGDDSDVSSIRSVLEEFAARKDITDEEKEVLFKVSMSLEPIHRDSFVNGVRSFVEKRKVVEIDPTSTDLRFKLTSQGVNDSNAHEMENKCARALCWVTLYDPDNVPVTCMNAIPLTGVYFLVPWHFLSRAKDDWSISVHWVFGNQTHKALCDIVKWFKIAEDAAILSFPEITWRAPGLIKSFIHEKEVEYLKESPLSVITRKRELNEIGIYSTIGERLTTPGEYEDRDDVYTIVNGFHYQINTRRGDCGAPVIVHDKSVPHKIIGMHVAGMEGIAYGMCNLITYEMLEEFVSGVTVERSQTCVAMGTIELLGVIPEGLSRPSQPRKTGFYRTHVTSFPVPKQPVNLAIRNGCDPVLCALMKNARERPESTIPKHHMERITKHLARYFPEDRRTSVLTDDETINGYVLAPLNLKSSMGYPYVLANERKHEIFERDLDGTTRIVDESFYDDWRKLENQLAYGPPDIYWVSCGKDECLVPGKEPRVFEIPPFHYTLSMRKHFGAMISWIHSNPLVCYSAIGINPESMQWNLMYHELSKVSNLGIDFDWKKFDSTFDISLIRCIEYFADAWYGSRSIHRSNLLRALEVRPTFFEQFLFLIKGGNPSGNVLTTILNTVAQTYLMMDAWLTLATPAFKSLWHFERYVRAFYYGDDGIMSVHPDVRHFFNFVNLRDHFAKYLMTITCAAKDNSESYFKPLSELTFLKRGFRKDERGIMVPILALNSLYTMVNYNYENKKVSPDVTFDVVAYNFCAFAYFYGENVYNELVGLLGWNAPDWTYWDNRFYGCEEYITFQTF